MTAAGPDAEMEPLDPLTLPLHGARLIEASAGTGKTWTLAALYLRLVLGHGCPPRQPPQILVMTFTEAATAELKGRIRERLVQAQQAFRAAASGDLASSGDALLDALREDVLVEPAEGSGRGVPGGMAAALARLDGALQAMDEAAIHTLHGWSLRMLREHAFDSLSLFEQSAVVQGERQRQRLVADHWRRWLLPLPPEALAALGPAGQTPRQLLQALQPLWREAERAPRAPSPEQEPPAALYLRLSQHAQRAAELEREVRAAWPAVAEVVAGAIAAKRLKGYRKDRVPKVSEWAQEGGDPPDQLKYFTRVALQALGWEGADTWAVFAHIEALLDIRAELAGFAERVLIQAAEAVAQAWQAHKQRQAQFDFADLLQRLHGAVCAPDGRMAATLRAQYPVALVDEFQDTDPWQFGTLERIYLMQPEPLAEVTLILIGDPKQAIYGFRGADLNTYLGARERVHGRYTLPGNHRSSAAVVEVINHLFARQPSPFERLQAPALQARAQGVVPLARAGGGQAALTVWRLRSAQPLKKAIYNARMAEAMAAEAVTLLNEGVVQPRDFAFLVRDGSEARVIRRALARRRVRTVYLSERDNVFASQAAQDLWLLLRAVLLPAALERARAALTAAAWALPLDDLEVRLHDDAAWDALSLRLLTWQGVWRQQGVLPMLRRWLHDEAVAQRLLAQPNGQGERTLTNLLHLGELLQQASAGCPGEAALLRWFEQQMHDEESVLGDTALLRLESDEALATVVTMHKAKGLEYPCVFLPFAANFKVPKARKQPGEARDADELLQEELRLLYVALTRAKRAVWLGVGERDGDFPKDGSGPRAALSRLLGRRSADDLGACLQDWSRCAQVQVLDLPAPHDEVCQPALAQGQARAALQPQRRLGLSRWTASFSALARGLDGSGERPQGGWGDEGLAGAEEDWRRAEALAASPWNSLPAGSAFGSCLHALLEWQTLHGWPLRPEAPATRAAAGERAQQGDDARWAQQLQAALRGAALPDALAPLLHDWVTAIGSAELPVDGAHVRLADLAPGDVWPEMAFTLPVRGLSVQALDEAVSATIWPGVPRAPLPPRRLEGMLTGVMDLVFRHGQRHAVLDHKSNRLPSYDADSMAAAVLEHRYDVQGVLYLLALHRLLRARLPAYRMEQHLGDAMFLFARGVAQPGAGLLALRVPHALVLELDAAFRGDAA